MKNMATMARDESATLPGEREYAAWLKQLRTLLSCEVDENGLASDLHADGATPEEAADELNANL